MIGVWLSDVRNVGGDRPGKLLTLDDRTAQVVCWIDSEAWMRFQSVLKKDTLIFAMGDLGLAQREGREAEWRLYARDFHDLDGVVRERTERIIIDWIQGFTVQKLKAALDPVKAAEGGRVTVRYANDVAKGILDLGPAWRIRPNWAFLLQLRRLLGADRVSVNYRKWQAPVSRGEPAFHDGAAGYRGRPWVWADREGEVR
jgi:DNA polymerase-3 subunit alpha